MVLDEDMKKTLTELKRKRGVVKGSLTRIRTFVDAFDSFSQPLSLLEFRQEELPRLNKKFDDVQGEIELLSTEEFDNVDGERDKFEAEYFSVRSQIQEIINSRNPSNIGALNNSFGTMHPEHRVQLAPIVLPTFSGNIEEWTSFYESFQSMVHKDNGLSIIQKFHYLRTSVTDSALNLIRPLQLNEANYDVAIQILKNRYDNPGLTIQSHIRALLNSPYVENASAHSLQGLHTHVNTHVAALKALDQPVEYWDAWLITITVSRLDQATRHAWELRQVDTRLPKFESLSQFLNSRSIAYDNSEAWSSTKEGAREANKSVKKLNPGSSTKRVALMASSEISHDKCSFCKGKHRLYTCPKFKELSISDRFNYVRGEGLCFNCLSPFHMASSCKCKLSCQKCKRSHNTLLHFESQANRVNSTVGVEIMNDKEGQAESSNSQGTTSPQVSLAANKKGSHVFLSTAMVLITDSCGKKQRCRAILDCGSQVNFISRSLLNKLQLPCKKTELPVHGIGSSQVRSSGTVDVKVTSRVREFDMELSCFVLPVVVSELAPCTQPKGGWKIPNELVGELADPLFFESSTVDLLIGGGSFYDLLEVERVGLAVDSVSLQNTKLGWLVTGELGATCLLVSRSIGNLLEEEWMGLKCIDNDDYGRSSKTNQRCIEEQQTLDHFQNTANRAIDGRFILRLPLKTIPEEIGDTLRIAQCRFFNVEQKLQRDHKLQEAYIQFMEEYLRMGHMEVVAEANVPQRTWYLPHHAVIKSSSLTTKVRVVFDASAKSTSDISLNDLLMCGPVLQDNVFTILSRFRKHQYVLTADIEKMYRQILVSREDCDMQRILWRASPSEPLETYRLLTVTYGTKSASFMATRCLTALAERFNELFPVACKIIKEDFYMDDLMTGSNSEEGILSLQQNISTILNSAKLPLRKWCSNSPSLLKQIGNTNIDPLFALEIGDTDIVKSLGLLWKPFSDEFRFDVTSNPKKDKLSKRVILSDLNRVFDPLGFLTPVLIKGKIFLQQLWQIKSDWDTSLSDEIQMKWREYYSELIELKNVSIPRCAKCEMSKFTEIHGFCDASEEAYGACVYIRSQGLDGRWHSRLLCSRSRVAPLKGATIPRLELNGALVLAQLVEKVSKAWDTECHSCYLWSDSTIILSWLNAESVRLKVYVANRVSQILEITNRKQWRYVSTNENPADIITRGIKAKGLSNANLWWNGPNWLSNSNDCWPQNSFVKLDAHEIPEQRTIQLTLIGIQPVRELIQYYSTWVRLQRGIAWMQRFINYIRTRKVASKDHLSVFELRTSEICILKQVQNDEFYEEIQSLMAKGELKTRSKLRCLYPFLKDGLILVGGRLDNSNLIYKRRHPIVLPGNHKVTRLIFEQRHQEQLHCGPQALLAEVRRKYWPLRGRVIARSVVLKCIRCQRAQPRFDAPLMAPLPKQRVQYARPFAITGIDFAGPIIIKSGIRRVVGIKAWIAVFVCFTTRAVHLEAVEDLSSKAFLAALRRFTSRRGLCTTIFSDNGTNFVGVQKELDSYIKAAVPQLAQDGIEWRFNPPSAPHFGGLWESAVKSAKYHLTRIMGEAKLTIGELNTLLCQIEACLNSRPLTLMSSDPSELEALTPAHFLIGGPISLPPEADLEGENVNNLRRWKYVQALMQTFWRRWKDEYLPQLQVRGKWTTNKPPLKIEDIVVIKDECTRPTKWKLGRIVQLHPGKDGIIRVATVRLGSGLEIKRPTVKLCVLPTEPNHDPVENDYFQRGENVGT